MQRAFSRQVRLGPDVLAEAGEIQRPRDVANFARAINVILWMRFLLVLVAWLAPEIADACSCVPRTLAQNAKAEKRVFLARAGKPVKTGDALEQKFFVLMTFKGPNDTEFKLDRPATPPCAANYAEGDVAILFTTAGDLDPCHGNLPLASQAEQLPALVKATRTAKQPIDAAAMEVALRKALAGFTHARVTISVQHAALAGRQFELDKSKIVYEKKLAKDAVTIADNFTAGAVSFVRGSYNLEGLRFTIVLLLGSDGKWSVIDSSVAER